MCLRFLLLEFMLEIKKNIQQLETLLSQFPCLNLFFYDFKGFMPLASVETCLDDVINGMIASGQFFFSNE